MNIKPYSQAGKGQAVGPSRKPEGMSPAPAGSTTSFSPGQLLSGRVLRVEEGGRLWVAVGQEVIAARTPLCLTVGSQHWFEVRRGGAEPWLVLTPGKGAALELLRLLTAESSRGAALQLLLDRAASQQFTLPSAAAAALWRSLAGQLGAGTISAQPDPASVIFSLLLLQAPIEQSGERGCFRRQLAELIALLPSRDAGHKELAHLARLLALYEETSRLAAPAERFLLVPCLLAGQSGWGEWCFGLESEDRQDPSSGPAYRLSFFLRLSRLGELYLQVDRKESSLRGHLHVASHQARQHLEGFLPELNARLKALGFHSALFTCQVAERPLQQELQEELRRRAGLPSLALVDLRA